MIETKFKNTEIGLIPEDWEVENVERACSIKARIGWQGLTTSEYLSQGNYILITGTDFKDGFIDWDNCNFVSEWRYRQDVNIQIKNGDTLITKDGTIGKVAFVDEYPMPATLNSGVFVIRPKDNNVDNFYLAFVFKSFWFCDFIDTITAGSTIVHLYQKDFVKFNFPLPPLSEQRRIAEVLSQADELIKQWENVIAKKRDIKTATMQLLLTGKKRLNGYKDEWVEKSLADVGDIQMCKRIMKYQTTQDGEIPFYKIGTFGKEADAYISKDLFAEYKNKYNYPKKGDILLSAAGTIGRTVVFDGKDSYFQDSNIVWINNDETTIINCFLYYIYQIISWITDTGTIPRIYNGIISSVKFFVPPTLSEQRAIAEILSDMDEEIKTLEAKVEKLRNIKSGMMQQLLSGKIRLVGEDAGNVRQFVENNFGQMTYAAEDEAAFGL